MKKYLILLLSAIIICSSFGCSERKKDSLDNTTQHSIDSNIDINLVSTAINNIVHNNQIGLYVHYNDVGQADSALLISNNHAMMIDGGNVSDSNLIYSYLSKYNINILDCIVGTHAHEDHIGGLSAALMKAKVKKIYLPELENKSDFYINFKSKAESLGIPIKHHKSGEMFYFGNCVVQFYTPSTVLTDDFNNSSIIVKVICGDTSFLFAGDAESQEEQDVIAQGYNLNADVLKVGHHGSSTSSSYLFLREVIPKNVIISVEKNLYGHPDENTLSRLYDVGATIY